MVQVEGLASNGDETGQVRRTCCMPPLLSASGGFGSFVSLEIPLELAPEGVQRSRKSQVVAAQHEADPAGKLVFLPAAFHGHGRKGGRADERRLQRTTASDRLIERT